MRRSRRLSQNKKPLTDGTSIRIRSEIGSHEEPGTLLKMNVHLSDDENQDTNEKNEELDIKKRRKRTKIQNEKGALVRFNASNYEEIVHKDRIKMMFDDHMDSNNSNLVNDANHSTENDMKKESKSVIKRRSRRHLSSLTNSMSPEKTSPKSKTVSAIVTPNFTSSSTANSEETSSNISKSISDSPKKKETKAKEKKNTRNITKKADEIKDKIKKKPKTENKTRKRKATTQSKTAKAKPIPASKTNKNKASKVSSTKNTFVRKRKRQKVNEEEANIEADKVESISGVKQEDQNNDTNMQNRNVDNQNVDNEMGDLVGGEPDGNGGLDQPSDFSIEYSPTGRATCRRCDNKISKNELRVSHRPLFRGKPGFLVYRHLQCIVFSPDITDYTQVDGHHTLKPEDKKKLIERIKESNKERKQEMEELRPDELVQEGFQGEIRPHPPGLAANLLPFQVEGFSWMIGQEKKNLGGILADEMGMGKTIQTISTILDNRPKLQHALSGAKFPPTSDKESFQREEDLWDNAEKDWKHELNMRDVPEKIRPNKGRRADRAGTLVVCPMIALHQWKTEIEKFTNSDDGTILSVGIYHGQDREKIMPRILMKKYDVVLTTYQVLEQDMRKMINPNKVKCPNCGKKFKVDKLRIHLKYFCGETAQRTEAQSRQRRGRNNSHLQSRRNFNNKDSKKSATKKKAFTKTKSFSKGKSKEVKNTEDESSSLSETEQLQTPIMRGRSSRKSASQASKKLASSMKSWAEQNSDDDEEYEGNDALDDTDSDTDLMCDDYVPISSNKVQNKRKKKENEESECNTSMDSSDSSDDSDNSEDEAEKAAIEKQRQALKMAKHGKKGKKNTIQKEIKSKSAIGKKKKVVDSLQVNSTDIDMESLMEEAMAGSRMSVLHGFCWWRVVLDEAHTIKTRNSQTTQAAFALTSVFRWCLSGTPLQNRVGEFYSLIRFLRIDPMAHYFCRSKDCNCKSLHYRMEFGKCRDCGHGSANHYSHFNRYVLNPIQRDGYSGDGRRAMFLLKDEVLDKCLLRRTKDSRAADMNLPPRIVKIRKVRLHPIEEDFYNALYTQTKSSFSDYVADGTLLNNYAHIFDLLMRMRQSVDHPYLIVYSKRGTQQNFDTSSGVPSVANGSTECEICHETPIERILSSCCQSAFCKTCVIDYINTSMGIGAGNGDENSSGSVPCPSCRAPFSIDMNQAQPVHVSKKQNDGNKISATDSTPGMPSLKTLANVATGSILRRIDLSKFATSSKIEALTEELVKMRQTSPGSKAIVFSQFVNMLDLIRWRLHSDPCLGHIGLGATALHGGMDVKSRNASLEKFREDNNIRVLLISLKAGGVALNLTVANHIYLMDPWWNPAAEMQAIDRTHRLGQYRPIRAVRFIAENTVEERILQLQEKKRLVFDGTVGRDAGSLKMLTVDDMKSLFV